MTRNERGFTLIELMIVIAIIAIIAAIAIPNLLAARLSANETAAIATLRNIVSAQAQFQQGAKADEDLDGVGEYGGFVEMSGGNAGRMAAGVLVPPVLSQAFQTPDAAGIVTRSGYAFRMFLPDVAGLGGAINETDLGFAVGVCDPDLSETTWCCYAWPVNYQQSGNRTFFVNQAGDVLGTDAGDPAVTGYEGTAATIPSPYAIFTVAGDITSPLGIGGAVANDGHTWVQVN